MGRSSKRPIVLLTGLWQLGILSVSNMSRSNTMHVTIVSSRRDEVTVAQFKEKADALGIGASVEPVTLDDIASGRANEMLGNCVLWRLSSLGPSGNGAGYGLMDGRISINSALYVMPEIGNKYFQQQVLLHSPLSAYAVPTYYTGSYEKLEELINAGLLEYPVIIKPVHGASSRGVVHLKDEAQARTHQDWGGYIAEPYIENRGEWRVFVVGGVATGAMKKVAAPGKKINHVEPGALVHAEVDEMVRDELYDIATRVSSLFHMELNGVDIVRDRRTGKLYILEVNVSPGWQNRFDRTTGEDIPARVFEWFDERFTKDEHGLAVAIHRYLTRRSYRLPLIDEFILIDILHDYSPAIKTIITTQQRRLLGTRGARVIRLIDRMMEREDGSSLGRILRLLVSIRRYYPSVFKSLQEGSAWQRVVATCLDAEKGGYENFSLQDRMDVASLGYELGILGVSPKHDKSFAVVNLDDVDVALSILRHKLPGAEAVVPQLEVFVRDNFFRLHLRQRLEFVEVARLYGYATNLGSLILQHASTLCSWAGNFLVEDTPGVTSATTGMSARHTLRQSYYESALYSVLARLHEKEVLS